MFRCGAAVSLLTVVSVGILLVIARRPGSLNVSPPAAPKE
jgi:hypothetical protein